MRVLAIDPGYERLGIAIVEKLPKQKEALLYSACIQTSKTLAREKRLLAIADAIAETIAKWKPDALAIETLFFHTNQKTVMPVSEARGAVLVEAARAGLKVFEYTPLQIKIAVTGYGRSDKRQVTEMVKKLVTLPEEKSLPPKTAYSLYKRENKPLPPTCPPKPLRRRREKAVLPLIREKKSLASQTRHSLLQRENKSRLDDEYDAIAVGLACLASEKWNMK